MGRSSLILASLGFLACSGGGGDPDAASAIDAAGNTPDSAETPDAPGTPDTALPVDARLPALGCLGDPLPGPGDADDPVTISGDVFDPGIPGFVDPAQLSGVNLDSFAYGDEITPLDSDVSAATTGAYSLTAATSTNPLNAYIRAQQSGDPDNITTYVYPGTPTVTDQTGIRIPMIAESTIDLLELATGLSQTADQGLVTVIVVDCAGDPITGATVTSTPAAGQTAYIEGNLPSTTATATDSTGLAFLLDVPIGNPETSVELEVNATYDGMPLRAHTVTVPEFVASAQESRMVTTQVVP